MIYGLPCEFIKFDDKCKDITEETLNVTAATEETPGGDETPTPGGETPGGVSGNVEYSKDFFNLRAEIWDIMCNIDGLKDELLTEHD